MTNRILRYGTTMSLCLVLGLVGLVIFAGNVQGAGRTYTTDADFDEGILVGVEHETVHDQLQLSKEAITLPFVWVPNSNGSTVSKIDTETGKELGRYRVAPSYSNPSRTTVDLQGNCWVGNRCTGTAVKIGLFEAGQYIDRNGNGTIETSQDLNGDGDITGSEILPWGQDECVLYEVVLIPGYEGTFAPGEYTGPYTHNDWYVSPRGFAVDASNNVWIGTWSTMKYCYIDGATGEILKTIDVSPWSHHAYGAVIDARGILWSSGQEWDHILRLDPSTEPPTISTLYMGHFVYGLGLDYFDHLFASGWCDNVFSKVDILPPIPVKEWTKPTTQSSSRGVAATSDNNIWIANSGSGTVTRYDNEGNRLATIWVGSEPTGVAVDSAGKVWVCNFGDEYIHRIDPATNTIDLSKRIVGGRHYSYSDMTGIIARTITTYIGTWTVVYDSKEEDTPWGIISWTSDEPEGTLVQAEVRSSNDQSSWSAWETASNEVYLTTTPDGRYVQIKTTLQIIAGEISPIIYDLTVESGEYDVYIARKDISFSPDYPFPETPVNLFAAVHCDDASSSVDSVEVCFYDERGAQIGDDRMLYNLATGECDTAEMPWDFPDALPHVIWVKLDPDNQLSEYNEDNNEASNLFVPKVPAVIQMIDGSPNYPQAPHPVYCYIELPHGYHPKDIHHATICLSGVGGIIHPKRYPGIPWVVGDYDGDGVDDLMVTFEYVEIMGLFTPDSAVLTLAGEVAYHGSEVCPPVDPVPFEANHGFATGAPVYSIDVSDDGQYIAAGSYENGLYFLNGSCLKLWSYPVPIPHGWSHSRKKAVAISSDGNYVAAGGTNDSIYLFDKYGALLWAKDLGSDVLSVGISSDGSWIVGGTLDGRICFFSKDNSTPEWCYDIGHRIQNLVISDNGQYIAVGEYSHRGINLFDSAGSRIWRYSMPYGGIVNVDISADGTGVVAGSDDGSDMRGCLIAYFSDSKDGLPGWSSLDGVPKCFHHPPQRRDDFYDVAISGDGEYFCGGGASIPTYLFDVDCNMLHDWSTGGIRSLDISYDGAHVAVGLSQGNVFCFSKDDDQPVWMLPTGSRVNSIAISADGSFMAAGCTNGNVYGFWVPVVDIATVVKRGETLDQSINTMPGAKATFIHGNRPNPFSSGTSISYGIAEFSPVTLKIYDATGRIVATLVNENLVSGCYSMYWDGKDQSGHEVGTGIYFYRLRAGQNMDTKKMIRIR